MGIIVPDGYRQPVATTSLEKMLELKKRVSALERQQALLLSQVKQDLQKLTLLQKQTIKELNRVEKELANHLMNTSEGR